MQAPARGRVIAGGFTQKVRKTTMKSTCCGGKSCRRAEKAPLFRLLSGAVILINY
jgi:hypothetical protein